MRNPGVDDPAAAGSVDMSETVAALLRTPFDVVLTDPVRLRLQAALHGLPPDGSIGFTGLRRALQLSDGNLGAHLAILVDAGYADATATWRGKRRSTRYAATSAGRAAFDAHVQALESVIRSAQTDQTEQTEQTESSDQTEPSGRARPAPRSG